MSIIVTEIMNSKALRIFILHILSVFFFITKVSAAPSLLGIFPKGDKPNGLLFFILTVLALFVALFIHELGHLMAGLVQGFRFQLFVIGLLGIKRVDNKIKLFLNKNIGYMGGIAATVPVGPNIKNKRKFAVLIAAGPLASLSFSILAFILFTQAVSGAARGFWFVEGASSVAIFFATTLPTKSGIFFTDRARFQRLMSKGKAGATEEALLTIIAQNVADNSCKHIPLDKAKLLQGDKDQMMRFWGHYYEFCYFKDNKMQEECEGARKKLQSIKDSIPAHLWKALKIDEAGSPVDTLLE